MSGDDVYSFLEDIAGYPKEIILKIKEGGGEVYIPDISGIYKGYISSDTMSQETGIRENINKR